MSAMRNGILFPTLVLAALLCLLPRLTVAQALPEDILLAPFDALYAAAVLDAQSTLLRLKSPPPAPRLQDIDAGNPALIWSGEPGESLVLATTFTQSRYYATYRPGQPLSAAVDLWVVPAPQMREDILRDNPLGAALSPKLAASQYLGLPPRNRNDSVVSLWVNPADLVRPAIDPRTDTHELETSFVVSGQNVPLTPAQAVPRESLGPGLGPAPDYLTWFLNREATVYSFAPGGKPYPWTGLGYTYDWTPAVPDVVGGSEFVAPQGSRVVFQEMKPVADYLR